MDQRIRSILSQVASDTLEKLAFLFAFADDERDTDGPEPAISGRVEFNGYFLGSLVIRVSTSALNELAVNMLGLDDDADISVEEQQDAFKELLNVICGNALPAIAGNQVEFAIGPPEILLEGDTAVKMDNVEPGCVARLMLEDGFCDVYFLIEGELPESVLANESEQMQ